jgi:hypothetical protein
MTAGAAAAEAILPLVLLDLDMSGHYRIKSGRKAVVDVFGS